MKIRRFGIVVVLGAVLLAVLSYAVISLSVVNTRLEAAQQTRDALAAEAQALAVSNASLEYEIAHSDDLDMIEKVARDKLGLVLPGEIIYYDISD